MLLRMTCRCSRRRSGGLPSLVNEMKSHQLASCRDKSGNAHCRMIVVKNWQAVKAFQSKLQPIQVEVVQQFRDDLRARKAAPKVWKRTNMRVNWCYLVQSRDLLISDVMSWPLSAKTVIASSSNFNG